MVELGEDVWEDAIAWSCRRRRRETGGICLGWRTEAGVYVERLVQVLDRDASSVAYRRRRDSAEAALQRVLAELVVDSPVGYVGEWHSHLSNAGPSLVDRWELWRLSLQMTGAVALLVCAQEQHSQWTPYGLCARRGRMRRADVLVGKATQYAR